MLLTSYYLRINFTLYLAFGFTSLILIIRASRAFSNIFLKRDI